MAIYKMKECKKHGETNHRLENAKRWRCIKCSTEYRIANRQRNKDRIVQEHGGACNLCGYNRYQGALEFHHLDPTTKDFAISVSPTNFSYERLRTEAKKCILLCSNCHREVEAGVATIDPGYSVLASEHSL